MKKIFTIFFLICTTASAVPELPPSTMKELQSFAKRSLHENVDLEEVKKNIEILLILDDEDPSRTAVFILSESYLKNTALYDRAIQAVENSKNKKKLSEIKTILKNYGKKGNG